MATSEATLQTRIDAIDAELATIAASSSALVNWKAGRMEVDKTSRVRELLRIRKALQDQMSTIPTEEVTIFDESAD